MGTEAGKKLKTAVDVLSVASFIFLVIICPLWLHYHPHTRDTQGHFVLVVKASFVVTPICVFGHA
jgi:hypothetical protein